MKTSRYVVTNPFGLHTRISADLIRTIKGYESRVDILFGDSVYSNDSILMLMQSGISRGGVFTLRVEGVDEAVCFGALDAQIKAKVGDQIACQDGNRIACQDGNQIGDETGESV